MSESARVATGTEDQPALIRAIGPKLLFFFILCDVLGTGIYAVSGDVAAEVGGALWAPFIAVFAIAMCTATSYLELVGKYPRAAGAALYTHRAFRIHLLTFIVAFAVMASGITSASAASVAFGSDYLAEFVTLPTIVVALAFIAVLALVNFIGVGLSVKANAVATVIEVTGLLVIIVIGAIAVGAGNGDPSRLTEFNPSAGSAFAAITAGAALAFYAIIGFEDSVNMAEETKDPPRVFPPVLFAALTTAGIIYILVAISSSLLVPTDRLAGSDGPLLEVVEIGAPAFPLWVFSIFALVAVTNGALINLIMASRLVYGMSEERVIPRLFGKVHASRHTPWVAVIFTTSIAFALLILGQLAGQDLIDNMASTTAFFVLCAFTVVNIAVLVLRREPVEHRHYRAPTALPVIGAICCAFLATPFAGTDTVVYQIAGILLLIGLILWAINRVVSGPPKEFSGDRLGQG